MGWQRGNGNRMRWHTSINPVINSRISEKEEEEIENTEFLE